MNPENQQTGSIRAMGRGARTGYALLMAVGLLAWAVLSVMALFYGELNQDEGWYLYAAKLVRAGEMPYRDFAFTQGPVMPLVYASLYGWVERFGVAGGRAATFLFSALALVAAVWLAMRVGPRGARRTSGGLCFLLLALNAYQCTFSTMVKTYALSSFLFMLGLLLLSRCGRQGGVIAPGVAGFLLAMATATRVSFGVALLAGGIYLVLVHRRTAPWAWLDYGLGGALGLGLLFLPFYAFGRDGFLFGLFEYHTLREAGAFWPSLQLKAGALSRLMQAYFPAFVLLGMLAFRSLCICRNREVRETIPPGSSRLPSCYSQFLWIILLVMAGIHLAAPFPYDDYQVPLYPLFCVLIAAGLTRHLVLSSLPRMPLLFACALLALAYAFGSPTLQGWFIAGRDRIWWQMRQESPIQQLRRVGAEVRQLAAEQGGTQLLTQDVYLAVESGLAVPRGLEMGPFSYYPKFSTARAEQVKVVNRPMLVERLTHSPEASVAAVSGYSFAIRSPDVLPVCAEDEALFQEALAAHYVLHRVEPAFGQASTALKLLVRRP